MYRNPLIEWILADVGKIDVQVNILIEIRTWKIIFKYTVVNIVWMFCKTFMYRVQGTDHPYKRKMCE